MSSDNAVNPTPAPEQGSGQPTAPHGERSAGPPKVSADATGADADREPRREARTSFLLQDLVLEQVYDGVATRFISRGRDGSEVSVDSHLDARAGRLLVPLSPDELRWSSVLLPARPEAYGTTAELDAAILAHVRRYVRLPREIEPVVPIFIRATWLYDRNRTVPYLRISGPPGSGKSRASRVIGHLCQKPYVTNASTTVSALFRNMGKLGLHTLVLDEAEHDKDNEMQKAITQILKVGFERGGRVERVAETAPSGAKQLYVQNFDVFSPKIIAAINHVRDRALQSRCITVHMVKDRNALVELPDDYEDAVQWFQNRLLRWRLDNYFQERPEPIRLSIEPRLLQLYWPLARVAGEGAGLKALDALMIELQAEIDEEAENAPEALIAEAMWSLLRRQRTEPISYEDIRANIAMDRRDVDAVTVGTFVKRRLGLKVRKPHRGSRVIEGTSEEIRKALTKAGYPVEEVA